MNRSQARHPWRMPEGVTQRLSRAKTGCTSKMQWYTSGYYDPCARNITLRQQIGAFDELRSWS